MTPANLKTGDAGNTKLSLARRIALVPEVKAALTKFREASASYTALREELKPLLIAADPAANAVATGSIMERVSATCLANPDKFGKLTDLLIAEAGDHDAWTSRGMKLAREEARRVLCKEYTRVRQAAVALLHAAQAVIPQLLAEVATAETELFDKYGAKREPTSLTKAVQRMAATLNEQLGSPQCLPTAFRDPGPRPLHGVGQLFE